MVTDVYSIYDNVAKEFGPLFEAKNLGVAMRFVESMIKDHPVKLDDYYLVNFGWFDNEAGCLHVDDIVRYRFDELLSDTPIEEVE